MQSVFKLKGIIMSDWIGGLLKRVERSTGANWLEFLDEKARPAVRELVQHCSKYAVQCVGWIKRKGRAKEQSY
jgi:hypothetical protein